MAVLKARGAEVSGGGNGAPFRSPLTLLFSGGSSGMATLSFFPFGLLSFPPSPLATALLRASSSSNELS